MSSFHNLFVGTSKLNRMYDRLWLEAVKRPYYAFKNSQNPSSNKLCLAWLLQISNLETNSQDKYSAVL